jgi:hypothetical protein
LSREDWAPKKFIPFELSAEPERNKMKILTRALALTLAIAATSSLQAQQSSSKSATASSPTKRTDIYHVFVVKAALGKAKELTEWFRRHRTHGHQGNR